MKKVIVIALLLGLNFRFSLATTRLIPDDQKEMMLKLPSVFADNMVLQQKAEDAIWGWATPGQKIVVKGSWSEDAVAATQTDKQGHWKLHLKTPKAGGPFRVTVSGKDSIVLHNVMIGEVWICSGQSNMEMPVKGWEGARVLNAEKEIKAADYPDIRLFKVQRKIAFEPQENSIGSWSECSPETVADFSATAYFFGKQLYEKLQVPVGLIETCWGGTVAEAWTSKEALEDLGDFDDLLTKIDSLKLHVKEMKAKQKAYTEDWNRHKDRILKKYATVDYDAHQWEKMNLPTYWENAGHPGLDGNIWYRKAVDIPKSWVGKALQLDLGPIDDNDITWFNGQKVGSTEGWQVERLYSIPGKLVKEGKNVIAVRVTDINGNGGIYGDSRELKIYPSKQSSDQSIGLAGNWKFKIGLRKHENAMVNNPNLPTVLHNGMIHPLIPFGIRGAIWYQGESNVGRAKQYSKLFPTMINDWRQKWGEGAFPFYFVQIAPYPYGGSGMKGAALRDAQRKALDVPHTGMAVTLDIGDTTNIHPANKEEVGRRLSLWALHKTYGYKNIVYSGPLYDKMKIKGAKVILSFKHTDGGLTAKGGKLDHFEIAGKNGQFVPAKAAIKGRKVIVQSDRVSHPKAVRYGWRDTAVPHLFNKAGLPASSFSTIPLK